MIRRRLLSKHLLKRLQHCGVIRGVEFTHRISEPCFVYCANLIERDFTRLTGMLNSDSSRPGSYSSSQWRNYHGFQMPVHLIRGKDDSRSITCLLTTTGRCEIHLPYTESHGSYHSHSVSSNSLPISIRGPFSLLFLQVSEVSQPDLVAGMTLSTSTSNISPLDAPSARNSPDGIVIPRLFPIFLSFVFMYIYTLIQCYNILGQRLFKVNSRAAWC